MGLLKVIEWKDSAPDVIVSRVDMKKDFISKGSKLTVRESQAAVFCDKGRMADVFLPGFYDLATQNVPLLTKMMSWKYGFESPFKSDVYFVSTRQFTNQKWGTKNPITLRDADYGAVRIRAFGTYAFKVADPFVFMTELSGTGSSFATGEITEWLRSIVVTRITDIIGECKIPVLDMAGNLVELGEMVEAQLADTFKDMGLALTKFNFENFSMPEALEKALDESTSLGILGKNMNTYMAKAQADALKDAAKNPGMAGATIGAGMGMGMGMGMGQMFGNMANNYGNTTAPANQINCPSCNNPMNADAKFCPSCGKANGETCSKCGTVNPAGTKFCSNCGNSLANACSKCGTALTGGAKFCPNCGTKN